MAAPLTEPFDLIAGVTPVAYATVTVEAECELVGGLGDYLSANGKIIIGD